MATVRENAARVLNAIYEDTGGDQSQLIMARKYVDELKLTEREVRSAADYLAEKGLVRTIGVIEAVPPVRISAGGVDAIEQAREHPTQETHFFPAMQNIINIGTMHGGGIQQGTTSSTQTANVSYSTADLTKLANELTSLLKALISEASSSEHHVTIGAIAGAEIAAKGGDAGGVVKALSTIGKNTAGWVTSVAGRIGANYLVQELPKLLTGS